MTEEEAWRFEERLWLEGVAVYEKLLDPQCVMAFAAPVGIMQGAAAIRRSLQGAPRWARIVMTHRSVGRPDAETTVLAYEAEAERDGGGEYRAFCTSTYRHRGQAWRLIQHQQTPVS